MDDDSVGENLDGGVDGRGHDVAEYERDLAPARVLVLQVKSRDMRLFLHLEDVHPHISGLDPRVHS